jgi:2-polyprenyl-6-methoxyphenol hydroxylase-like FAD-dependent oxidoreductase
LGVVFDLQQVGIVSRAGARASAKGRRLPLDGNPDTIALTENSMQARPLHIAIIGAGIGGLTAAACLRRIGADVRIYEQARAFIRLGAGIQQAPNAVRVLYALGLKNQLLAQAFQPETNDSRDHDTGNLTNSLPLGRSVLERHGVPYFLMHRGDLHAMLADLVPAEIVRLNHKLAGLDHALDGGVRLTFTNGDTAEADALIGADGVHSVVRAFMLGEEPHGISDSAAGRPATPSLRQMVGTGSPYRQLFRQSAPRRTIFRYQHPGAGILRGILVRQG